VLIRAAALGELTVTYAMRGPATIRFQLTTDADD
jgi:hypothetical protein